MIDVPVFAGCDGGSAGGAGAVVDAEGAVLRGGRAFVFLTLVMDDDVSLPEGLSLLVHDYPGHPSLLFLCADGTSAQEQGEPVHYKS